MFTLKQSAMFYAISLFLKLKLFIVTVSRNLDFLHRLQSYSYNQFLPII